MLKLGLITRNPRSYRSRRICQEAAKAGLETVPISFFDLDFEIKDGQLAVNHLGQSLPELDFLVTGQFLNFVPQWQYVIELYKKQTVVLNQASYLRWSRLDKISQHLILAQAGLPVVNTQIFGRKERLIEALNELPVVVKSTFGHQGQQVFKIADQAQMDKLLERWPISYLLVQEYLRAGADLRVICLGGEVVGAMKRTAVGQDFRSNYSVGGRIENYPIETDTAVRQLAERAARFFELDLGGIDLMKDNDGRWRILEVNRTCQFEGFEKATSINLAEKIIKFLLRQKNG